MATHQEPSGYWQELLSQLPPPGSPMVVVDDVNDNVGGLLSHPTPIDVTSVGNNREGRTHRLPREPSSLQHMPLGVASGQLVRGKVNTTLGKLDDVLPPAPLPSHSMSPNSSHSIQISRVNQKGFELMEGKAENTTLDAGGCLDPGAYNVGADKDGGHDGVYPKTSTKRSSGKESTLRRQPEHVKRNGDSEATGMGISSTATSSNVSFADMSKPLSSSPRYLSLRKPTPSSLPPLQNTPLSTSPSVPSSSRASTYSPPRSASTRSSSKDGNKGLIVDPKTLPPAISYLTRPTRVSYIPVHPLELARPLTRHTTSRSSRFASSSPPLPLPLDLSSAKKAASEDQTASPSGSTKTSPSSVSITSGTQSDRATMHSSQNKPRYTPSLTGTGNYTYRPLSSSTPPPHTSSPFHDHQHALPPIAPTITPTITPTIIPTRIASALHVLGFQPSSLLPNTSSAFSSPPSFFSTSSSTPSITTTTTTTAPTTSHPPPVSANSAFSRVSAYESDKLTFESPAVFAEVVARQLGELSSADGRPSKLSLAMAIDTFAHAARGLQHAIDRASPDRVSQSSSGRWKGKGDTTMTPGILVRDTILAILHELLPAIYADTHVLPHYADTFTGNPPTSSSSSSSQSQLVPDFRTLLSLSEWSSIIADLHKRNQFVRAQARSTVLPHTLFATARLFHTVSLRLFDHWATRLKRLTLRLWTLNTEASKLPLRLLHKRRAHNIVSGWLHRLQRDRMRLAFLSWRVTAASSIRSQLEAEAKALAEDSKHLNERQEASGSALQEQLSRNKHGEAKLQSLIVELADKQAHLAEARAETHKLIQSLTYFTQLRAMLTLPLAYAMQSSMGLALTLDSPIHTHFPAVQLLADSPFTALPSRSSLAPPLLHTPSSSSSSSSSSSLSAGATSDKYSPPLDHLSISVLSTPSLPSSPLLSSTSPINGPQSAAWQRFRHLHSQFWVARTRAMQNQAFLSPGNVIAPSSLLSSSTTSTTTTMTTTTSTTATTSNPLSTLPAFVRDLASVSKQLLLPHSPSHPPPPLSHASVQHPRPPRDIMVLSQPTTHDVPSPQGSTSSATTASFQSFSAAAPRRSTIASSSSTQDSIKGSSTQSETSPFPSPLLPMPDNPSSRPASSFTHQLTEDPTDPSNSLPLTPTLTATTASILRNWCNRHIVMAFRTQANMRQALAHTTLSSSAHSHLSSDVLIEDVVEDLKVPCMRVLLHNSILLNNVVAYITRRIASIKVSKCPLPSPLFTTLSALRAEGAAYALGSHDSLASHSNDFIEEMRRARYTATSLPLTNSEVMTSGSEGHFTTPPHATAYPTALSHPSGTHHLPQHTHRAISRSTLADATIASALVRNGLESSMPSFHSEPGGPSPDLDLTLVDELRRDIDQSVARDITVIYPPALRMLLKIADDPLAATAVPTSTGTSASSSSSSSLPPASPDRSSMVSTILATIASLVYHDVSGVARGGAMNLPEVDRWSPTEAEVLTRSLDFVRRTASAFDILDTQGDLHLTSSPSLTHTSPPSTSSNTTHLPLSSTDSARPTQDRTLPSVYPLPMQDGAVSTVDERHSRLLARLRKRMRLPPGQSSRMRRRASIIMARRSTLQLDKMPEHSTSSLLRARGSVTSLDQRNTSPPDASFTPLGDRAVGLGLSVLLTPTAAFQLATRDYHHSLLAVRRLFDCHLQAIHQAKSTAFVVTEDVILQASNEIRARAFLHAHDDIIPGIPASYRYTCTLGLVTDIPALAKVALSVAPALDGTGLMSHPAALTPQPPIDSTSTSLVNTVASSTPSIPEPRKPPLASLTLSVPHTETATPLPTATSVALNINGCNLVVSVISSHKAIRKLERVFSRCSRQLQSIFFHYAKGIRTDTTGSSNPHPTSNTTVTSSTQSTPVLGTSAPTTTGSGPSPVSLGSAASLPVQRERGARPLTMSHIKFWRFIRDCKLNIQHSRLVDQIVQHVLTRKTTITAAATAALLNHNLLPSSLASPSLLSSLNAAHQRESLGTGAIALADLTFHHFHEVLIRLALLKFPGPIYKQRDPHAESQLAQEERDWVDAAQEAKSNSNVLSTVVGGIGFMGAAGVLKNNVKQKIVIPGDESDRTESRPGTAMGKPIVDKDVQSATQSTTSTVELAKIHAANDEAAEAVAIKVQMLLAKHVLPNASHSATSSTYMQTLVSDELEAVFTKRQHLLVQIYQHYASTSRHGGMTVGDAKTFVKDYGLMTHITAHELKTLLTNIKSDLFMYSTTMDERDREPVKDKEKDKDSGQSEEGKGETKNEGGKGGRGSVVNSGSGRLGGLKGVGKDKTEKDQEKEREGKVAVAALSSTTTDEEETVPEKAEMSYREFQELLSGLACFVSRSPYSSHPDRVDDFIEGKLVGKPLPKHQYR